jgi:hypothetical protein
VVKLRWSDNVLPKLATVLGCRVEDLLGGPIGPQPKRAEPVGQLQRVFEQVRRLPRRQQRKVVEVLSALVVQYQRRAG